MDDAALAEVIRRAQQGDAAAFDRLVDAFGHRISGYLLRLTGSREDAEDLVQEVFVRLVRTIGSYRHDNRFEAWIFRIAANLARDRVRRSQRGPKVVPGNGGRLVVTGEEAQEALDRTAEAVDAQLVRGEQIDALNSALERLPVAEREVIMLRHFSQMSFREIAEITGAPLGTALARSHRGLARLREMMTIEEGSRVRESRAEEVQAKG